jgi:hypothetical protein
MSFNRRDLEGDDDDFNFDDNDFDFGDEDTSANDANDFRFDEDEPADVGLDNDVSFGDEDMPILEEEEEEREAGGVSRTFVILAAVLIILFVVGLGAVLLIASQPQGPTPNDLTATAIVATNQAVALALTETQVAQPTLAVQQTQTADALFIAQTSTAQAAFVAQTSTSQAAFEAQTATQSAILAATAQAQIPPTADQAAQVAALTQVAVNLTAFAPPQVNELTLVAAQATPVTEPNQAAFGTQVAALVTRLAPPIPAGVVPGGLDPAQQSQLTQVATLIQGLDPTLLAEANAQAVAVVPTETPPGLNQSDVALTATALASLLAPGPSATLGQGGGVIASPTPEGGVVGPGPVPTALPQTGFFDDMMASGSGGIGAMMLMGLGLVAVIIVSRRLRMANK